MSISTNGNRDVEEGKGRVRDRPDESEGTVEVHSATEILRPCSVREAIVGFGQEMIDLYNEGHALVYFSVAEVSSADDRCCNHWNAPGWKEDGSDSTRLLRAWSHMEAKLGQGVAMGTCMGPSYACLFVGYANFDKGVSKMYNFFLKRGFPCTVVDRALNQVQPISRTSTLTPSLPSRNSDRVPLVLTYHPTSIHIQKIVRCHFRHLQRVATTEH
eukprot:g35646.t1